MYYYTCSDIVGACLKVTRRERPVCSPVTAQGLERVPDGSSRETTSGEGRLLSSCYPDGERYWRVVVSEGAVTKWCHRSGMCCGEPVTVRDVTENDGTGQA